jgi:hypothetical protein
MLLAPRVSTSSSSANPIDGFDTLIVHPTATMHLSVNIIRLSNVHAERMLKRYRGGDGISSDECKLEGKADRGER